MPLFDGWAEADMFRPLGPPPISKNFLSALSACHRTKQGRGKRSFRNFRFGLTDEFNFRRAATARLIFFVLRTHVVVEKLRRDIACNV